METLLVIPPGDSKWWLLRPEFFAFIDKIQIDPKDYEKASSERNESGYQKLIWERLSVLTDKEKVILGDIPVSFELANQESKRKIDNIVTKEELLVGFIKDLSFAYRYWIDYNKQKLRLLPEGQWYAEEIIKQIPVWEDDLKLIREQGSKAFELKPEILTHTAVQILARVHLLNQTRKLCPGNPMTSLKEYEPFIKYIDLSFDVPLMTERTKLVSHYEGQPTFLDGSAHIGIDPDLEFLNFRLSQKNFWGRLISLFDNFKEARNTLREFQNRAQDVVYALAEAKFTKKVSDEFVSVNKNLKEEADRTRRRSKYLSKYFFGLSMIADPILSRVFSVICQKSENISERIESLRLYEKGFSKQGLSIYYGFLESLMDVSLIDKFPEMASDKKKPEDQRPFWRMDNNKGKIQ